MGILPHATKPFCLEIYLNPSKIKFRFLWIRGSKNENNDTKTINFGLYLYLVQIFKIQSFIAQQNWNIFDSNEFL